MEYFAGALCEVWQSVTQIGSKQNTYSLWITRPEGGASPPTPVHYEMMGYNTLLGSHYDKYLLDYTEFSSNTQDKDFSLPDGIHTHKHTNTHTHTENKQECVFSTR